MSGPSKPLVHDIKMGPDIVRMDPDANDNLLRGHGIVVEHHRAIKCPLGVDDRFDIRNHGDHSNCANGFIYKYVGDVTVAFLNNSSNSKLQDIGFMDGSTTTVTLPRTYDNSTKEVAVQHYDRFFLKDPVATSVNTQLVEGHITGIDRLQYLAVEIEHVVDANGIWYSDNDYTIEGGMLRWTSQHRPMFDPKLSKGTVYSVRYRYIPFWYVKNILHEVRVSKRYDHKTQKDMTIREPHQVLLQREYLFENEERAKNGDADVRDVKAPRNGSFGPR